MWGQRGLQARAPEASSGAPWCFNSRPGFRNINLIPMVIGEVSGGLVLDFYGPTQFFDNHFLTPGL